MSFSSIKNNKKIKDSIAAIFTVKISLTDKISKLSPSTASYFKSEDTQMAYP